MATRVKLHWRRRAARRKAADRRRKKTEHAQLRKQGYVLRKVWVRPGEPELLELITCLSRKSGARCRCVMTTGEGAKAFVIEFGEARASNICQIPAARQDNAELKPSRPADAQRSDVTEAAAQTTFDFVLSGDPEVASQPSDHGSRTHEPDMPRARICPSNDSEVDYSPEAGDAH